MVRLGRVIGLMGYLALACRCLIGVVFAVSAFGKLRSGSAFRDFRSWLSGLPVPLTRSHPVLLATAMAAAEVTIVPLAALPWTARAALVLAALVLAFFTAGTVLAVARGTEAPCQCFGASSSPLGRRHIIRNAGLCVAACVGALSAPTGESPLAATLLSTIIGLAGALVVAFLDDLVSLFTVSGSSAGDT